MGSLPLLPMLNWLRLIHDVVIVIAIVTDEMMGRWVRVTMVIDTSGMTHGGKVGRVRFGVHGVNDMRAGNGEDMRKIRRLGKLRKTS